VKVISLPGESEVPRSVDFGWVKIILPSHWESLYMGQTKDMGQGRVGRESGCGSSGCGS